MIKKTNFKGLKIFTNLMHKDNRGYFKEILLEEKVKSKFPFLVMSFSKKNVLRGLHLQTTNPQGKFVSVLKGRIYDVCVDLRRNSETFGKYFSIILSEKNSKSLFVPAGFAHGFCALEKQTYVIYSCTKYRNAKSEMTINYKDKDLKIKWPIKRPVVSKKDQQAISLKEFVKKYKLKKVN